MWITTHVEAPFSIDPVAPIMRATDSWDRLPAFRQDRENDRLEAYPTIYSQPFREQRRSQALRDEGPRLEVIVRRGQFGQPRPAIGIALWGQIGSRMLFGVAAHPLQNMTLQRVYNFPFDGTP